MIKQLLIIHILVFTHQFSFGQSVDFSVNGSCRNENLEITNSSTGVSDYLWDLCEGDLHEDAQFIPILTLSQSLVPKGIKVVNQNGQWFAFVTSRSSNSLFRIALGDDIGIDEVTITNLGNVGGLLNGPEAIEMIKENENWIGFIHNGGDRSLIRLNFGGDLLSVPESQLIVSSVGSVNNGMAIAQSNNERVLIVSNSSSSNLDFVRFPNSFLDEPGILEFITSGPLVGVAGAEDLELKKIGNNWFGFIVGSNSRNLVRLNFGANLFQEPESMQIISTFASSPSNIQIEMDAGEIIGFVQLINGGINRLNFGNDITSIPNQTILQTTGSLNNTFAQHLIKNNSTWFSFSLDFNTKRIFLGEFPEQCNLNQRTSSEHVPALYSYGSAGDFYISLSANDSFDKFYVSKSVTITDNIAPEITISSQNICQSTPIQFNSSSPTTGLTFLWDFGDGSTSTMENPSHQYVAPGNYTVKLSVNDGTCDNLAIEEITVYPEPQANFDLPTGLLCSNQSLDFINTTLGDYNGFESYSWEVDGTPVASTSDLLNVELEPGNYEVKLIAQLPGCSTERIENISITEGPDPDFLVDNVCLGVQTEILNTTTGDVSAYDWDFGNGFGSQQQNPGAFEYSSTGEYTIVLTVENTAGCSTTQSQDLTVHALPDVNFENELSCELLSTQFTDNSTVAGANLVDWQWDFNDPGAATDRSNLRNPEHEFSTSGQFGVKLVVESNFGCKDSVIQTVEVLESPRALFEYDKSCLGEAITFMNTSTPVFGQEISSFAWSIDGAFSDEENPVSQFNTPGNYDVSLSVTSENLCSNTYSETIEIIAPPQINFDVVKGCANNDTEFVASVSGAEINEYRWFVNGELTAIDQTAVLEFDQSGNYEITVVVETTNGCVESFSRTVEIIEGPDASFTTNVNFGQPPLTVNFNAVNENAVSYFWQFGDGSTSTEQSPVHIYQNSDVYNASLTVTNATGCESTLSRTINAFDPIVDVAVSDIQLIDNQIEIQLQNRSNIAIPANRINIYFGEELVLSEVVVKELAAAVNGNTPTVIHRLSPTIAAGQYAFICIEAQPLIQGLTEVNVTNNQQCIELANPVVVSLPFPNPVTSGELNFSVVTNTEELATIKLFDAEGKMVRQFERTLLNGRTLLNLNVLGINSGVHLVVLKIGGLETTYRVKI